MIRVGSILDLKREVFGPVLHVATFRAEDLQTVIRDINATGYGLTFGLHTRIDDRVEEITTSINAGNIYVNRDQIGAVVGSQPFGGEGLSGTGPKAGGPHYLPRFCVHPRPDVQGSWDKQMDIRQGDRTASTDNPAPMRTESLPGPTGESNRLRTHPRDGVLCLGPGAEVAERQARMVSELGGHPVVASGRIDPDALTSLEDLSTVIWWGDAQSGRAYAQALARRAGPIVSLVTTAPDAAHVLQERHICIDTTAAGGNAALLAEMS